MNSVEVVLVPEVDLVDLFHVQRFVGERRDVQVTPGGEHLSLGLHPLLSVKVGLQHALIQQHVTHGFCRKR